MEISSNDMVERVAKALAGCEWREPPFNSLHTDSLNNGWRYKARRAIEAMREPTEAMVIKGGLMCDEATEQVDRGRSRGVYWAMIDAALAPSPTGQG